MCTWSGGAIEQASSPQVDVNTVILFCYEAAVRTNLEARQETS
jgi:hypothetical protein